MADLEERFEEEIDALRRARDELRVQVHLAAADARDLWDRLEHKWGQLESKAKRVSKEAGDELEDVGEAARLLVDEIRDGYRRIRDAL